jgi:hypothetical protein
MPAEREHYLGGDEELFSPIKTTQQNDEPRKQRGSKSAGETIFAFQCRAKSRMFRSSVSGTTRT